jgi:ATP-dependent exoDNAse (exonuclease V) beta subunit
MSLTDEKIRKEALDTNQSFIVQAPAGSGKTELLIQRYLKLMGLAKFPEEILAMTFTRKAATEMKERVFHALTNAQNTQYPEQAHERLTWELAKTVLKQDQLHKWQLMDNPARLRIVTIDSFCSSLTRRMPLMSRIGAGLGIQENAKSLYRETARNILALAESETNPYGTLVRNILRHIDNSKENFIKRIVQLLQKRDQWMISFFDPRKNLETHPLNKGARKVLEQTMAALIQSRLDKLKNLFTPEIQQRMLKIGNYSGRNLEKNDPSHPCACLKNVTTFPETTIDNLDIWKGFANLLLTQNNIWRKSTSVRIGFPAGKDPIAKKMKNDFLNLVGSLQNSPTLLMTLVKVKRLPRSHFTNAEWGLLKSTISLLAEINKDLKIVFSSRQITDFTEISISAINSLAQINEDGQEIPTDLLFYLDCKIRHFLVDEYQDTSYKQEELLYRLTSEWSEGDGKTLFIVGDPKQSIYQFRDAEVGLFIKTQKSGIGNLHLKNLSLKSNFRSQKNLVDWINNCFEKIFPKENDPDLGAITYTKSSAVIEASIHPGVVYHPVSHHNNSYAISEEEACKVTLLVKELQSKYPNNSVAILVRGRTHLNHIVKNFHESNISFKAQNIDSLTDRPAILDLLSLLRALRLSGDRTAWLAILRAPWCGLSLTDIHKLVELDITTPVWSLLNNPARISLLSEDGITRAKRLIQNIHPFFIDCADNNFRDNLEACWIRLGGPACLQGTNPYDIDVFFNKLEELISSGQEEQFENFDQILTELYASPLSALENTVQIMTMHKAKGLEFDFVILPGLGKKNKADEKRLVYWMPHGDNLLLAPIEETGDEPSPLYQFLSDLHKEKEEYETLRLLYVATTRAKIQLHLFGHLEPSKEENWKPNPQSLLNKLWPHIKEKWLCHEMCKPESSEKFPKDSRPPIHTIQRLPLDFSLPVPTDSILTGQVVSIEDEKYIEPKYYWAGNIARCLGNVLHRCLHSLAVENSENMQKKHTLESLKPKIKSALQGEGLPLDVAEEATKLGIQALTNILEDKRGLWILAPHEDAHSEYPLTYFQDNRYIRNIIDRTFVDDGIRWIIDYKTGTHRGEGKNLDIFLDNEVQRYRHQLNRYETALKKFGEKRPIKKALYFPMLKSWREIN